MTRKVKIETFTIFEAGSNQIFLEMGPRYNPPQDDTTVLRVGHKTTDPGGISVLLAEMAHFEQLQYAVTYRIPWFESGLQTSAWLSFGTHGAGLEIKWKGSGRARTIMLDLAQTDAMGQWMADRIDQGWTGWKSGVKQS